MGLQTSYTAFLARQQRIPYASYSLQASLLNLRHTCAQTLLAAIYTNTHTALTVKIAKQYDAHVHYARPPGVVITRGYPYSPTVSNTKFY